MSGPIPGPDLGACPECGAWRKAGIVHDCPVAPTATIGGQWYIENHEERARVRAIALPELDAASDELQRFFMHQIARVHRLTAEVCDLRQERHVLQNELGVESMRCEKAEAALDRISEQQPKVLAYIEKHGFVFDDIGNEPGNWKHLAFSIYTDLCEVDAIARAALGAEVEPLLTKPDGPAYEDGL